MTWKTDDHGLVFKPSHCKLYRSSHTWGMKLSQIGISQFPDFVGIATFSFQLPYAVKQIARLPTSTWFICNSKFAAKARSLKLESPKCKVFVNSKVHQKLIIVPDQTVYLGSLNMVNPYSTGSNESTIGIKSKEAYDWALENLWGPLLNSSVEII